MYQSFLNVLPHMVLWLKYSYKPGFVLFIIGVGLGSFFLDASEMRSKGLLRETAVARWLGLSYIVGSILLYIIAEFII